MRHNFFLIFLFVCFNILGQVEVIGPNDITICPDGDLNDISIIQLKEETANGFGGAGSFRSFTISLNENDFSFHQFGDVDVYSIQDSSFSNLQATFDNAQTLRVSYTVNGGSDGNADEISTIFISGLQVETSNVEDSGAEIRIQGADIGFGTAEKIADVSVLNYTPTLAASVPSFCAGNGNGVNLSIEKPTGDGFEYTIERKLSSQTDWSYTALTSAGNTQPSYWDVVTTAETYNYRAKIDGPSYCQVTSAYSNVVTVIVNRAQNVSFAETPSNITTQSEGFNASWACPEVS